MNRILRFVIAAISIIGLALLPVPAARAQAPYALRAQVDVSDITTDDTVTFTLTLTTPDNNAPQLGLPALDGFDVVGSQTASQYNVVNGNASASMVYAYQLQPTRAGDLTIPSLHLALNGQVLSTEPLTVHVTQGTGAPTKKKPQQTNSFGPSPFSSLFGSDPFNDPFFTDPFHNDLFSNSGTLEIRADANKTSVYVGEPIQYTVRVRSDAMILGEPEYEPPKFTGFWAHQPPETRRGVNGSEITTLLYPTIAGQMTIDPATIRADGGFFSNALEKQSQPLAVDVKPLPQGAPAEFNGAVGKFEITATPDKTATRVGDPVKVHVEIRGAGNFDMLPDPKWQNDPAWRAFDGKAQASSQVNSGQLFGTRTYERTLIPTKEGTLTIPATRYAYFDPSDEKYHIVETQPITVHVAPGDPSMTQNVTMNTAEPNAITPNVNGVRAPALRPSPALLTSAAKPLTQQPLFLALFLVPLGIVALDVTLGLRKRYLDANAAQRRASRALRTARRDLKKAPRAENVSVAVARITLSYLEDKMNRILLGVPHSALAQLLAAHGVTAEVIEQVIHLLLAGESSEFGKLPVQAAQQLAAIAAQTLQLVEEEWTE